MRWVQLFFGVVLTWGGLIWFLQVLGQGGKNTGSDTAPVLMVGSFSVMAIGVIMLISLIRWALFGHKRK